MNSKSSLIHVPPTTLVPKPCSRAGFQFRHAAIWLGAGLLATSCVNPNQPNAGYFALDQATAEHNRAYTHAIEDDSQQFRHRERMSQAIATEMATRNAPRVIYHTSVYGPHVWW